MERYTNNPFSENFGKVPSQLIPRDSAFEEIYQNFDEQNSSSNIYIITGPRGCGKTVGLNTIANHYKEENNWIVVNLNPYMDLFEQLASQLYDKAKVKKLFIKKEFNFSFKCVSFSISGSKPVTSIISIINLMLEYLTKKHIKILITIDEVCNNDHLRAFTHSFQSFISNGYSIYLLMTGLYNNVNALINHKQSTFLLRANKINLKPLNLRGIVNSYMYIFKIDEAKAIALAKLTKGYAFAFQLLGNLLFKYKTTTVNEYILGLYDTRLSESVYYKIWDDLSDKERQIMYVIATNKGMICKDIAKSLDIDIKSFQVYKMRLRNIGVIDTTLRNKISITLPRFKEFIIFMNKIND